jgi:nitroreductase
MFGDQLFQRHPIMALPTTLRNMICSCEKLCVKGCCGIESFDFSPVHIASYLSAHRGQPAEKTIEEIELQLNNFRADHGIGSEGNGYESDESEMNQIFSAEQVSQLVDEIEANLGEATEIARRSDLARWQPESKTPGVADNHIPLQPGNCLDMVSALNWRYATKKFDPTRMVGAKHLETILRATNLSASSYGLQPFQFVVVEDKALQEKLVPCSYNQPQVAQASHVIVLAVRTNIDEAYIRQYASFTEQVRGLEKGTLDDYAGQMVGAITNMDSQQRINWASKQTYILLGTLLATCATLGIDACPMEGFVADKYDELLGLDEFNLHASLVVPIGYRADDDPNGQFPKVRKPLSEMVVNISRA